MPPAVSCAVRLCRISLQIKRKRGCNLITEKHGKIIKGLGGLYNVRVQSTDGAVQIYTCRAKGVLHKNEEKLYIGDNVTRDGYHANYGFGRYTLALTWYAVLSGGSLDKVNYLPTTEYRAEITANYAAMLESVENAIKTPYAVTPSAGI